MTGEIVEGPRWVREACDFLTVPLLARPGSIVAEGAEDGRPDYDFVDGVTLHVFEPEAGMGAEVRVPRGDGAEDAVARVERRGDDLRVWMEGTDKPWRVLLRGVGEVEDAGGDVGSECCELGLLLSPEAGASEVRVRFVAD